jgi:hypothetical protein
LRSIPTGFLHNHPRLEDELGLYPHHIIIDRKDWEEAMFKGTELFPRKVDTETQNARECPGESETG